MPLILSSFSSSGPVAASCPRRKSLLDELRVDAPREPASPLIVASRSRRCVSWARAGTSWRRSRTSPRTRGARGGLRAGVRRAGRRGPVQRLGSLRGGLRRAARGRPRSRPIAMLSNPSASRARGGGRPRRRARRRSRARERPHLSTRPSGSEWALASRPARARCSATRAADLLYERRSSGFGAPACASARRDAICLWRGLRRRTAPARRPYHLRTALELFTGMVAEAIRRRAERELLSTGERVRNSATRRATSVPPKRSRSAARAPKASRTARSPRA